MASQVTAYRIDRSNIIFFNKLLATVILYFELHMFFVIKCPLSLEFRTYQVLLNIVLFEKHEERDHLKWRR
jgi:hypothetical protein